MANNANTNTNTNDNQQAPFWEFMQQFGPHGSMRAGAGIDHTGFEPQFPQGFPFEAAGLNNPWSGHGRWTGPWGGHGWHAWHGRDNSQNYREVPQSDKEEENDNDHDMESSADTMRQTPDESVASDAPLPPPPPVDAHTYPPHPPGAFPHPPPPPPAGAPNHPRHPPFHHSAHGAHGPHPFGHHRGRGAWHGRRGGRHGPNPSPTYNGPWDFRPLMHAFASHPFAQAFRECMDQARADPSGESNERQDSAFTPPVDVFNTEKAYVLHVSLPGALKEDIGVNWDGEKINIAGVVHRPGDEQFLQSLASSERKVGMFERSIKLPPPGSEEKEEVDSVGITAKMENGILIVTVPKTEKDWTQIHKVEIQ
ncbi:HSP20-like chaperone [Hypoxylon sp. EC38]|nr:HSP20-like chaperone [Hypoxylon sp. EC38]